MILYSYIHKILFTTILFILLRLIKLEVFYLKENMRNYGIIFFNDEIIYIINDQSNYDIIYYTILEETKNIIGTYDSIIYNKNIIKINETNILIFGLDNDYYFNYMNYQFSNKEITLKKKRNK